MNLTEGRLIELGYERLEQNNTIYFQNGNIIIVYRDTGLWEYCSDGNIEISGGIHFNTEAQLNILIAQSN